jgi:hypothetical protein
VVRVTDQRTGNTAEVVAAWIIAALTLGYMLPWAIAATRGKSNSGAIALVDLFAGWTLVGWIAALVMACGAHQPVMAAQSVNVVVAQQFGPPAPGWGPPGAPQFHPQAPPTWTHGPAGPQPPAPRLPGYPTGPANPEQPPAPPA